VLYIIDDAAKPSRSLALHTAVRRMSRAPTHSCAGGLPEFSRSRIQTWFPGTGRIWRRWGIRWRGSFIFGEGVAVGLYFLHAHRLGFRSPATGEAVLVEAALPGDFMEWKAALER